MYFILEIVCLVLIVQTIAYGLSVWLGRNSVADVFWGGTIAIASLWTIFPLLWFALQQNPALIPVIPSLVAGILTFLWGFRLFIHIGTRFLKKKKEDPRYAKMSEGWQFYYLRSYLQVFLLQGLLMLAMLAPVLSSTYSRPDNNFYFLGAGILIWAFGLIFEIIADTQLSEFVKTKKPGQIMTKGLWRYSRHPNYFGEVTLWWGIWLVTLPSELWYISLIAPLTITFLILKVSGVPMAEAHYADNEEFQTYAKQTNKFFPWKPKP